MLFFVKVRIDLEKMLELGQKLQSGELDTSNLKMIYCLQDDPSVGMSVWQAEDRDDFNQLFKPHQEFYQEVMEITPVITSNEAQTILFSQMARNQK